VKGHKQVTDLVV